MRQVASTFPTDLGRRIREARKAADLTPEEMAVRLDISMATLFRYERGNTKRISYERLAAISDVTGRPVSWFLTGEVTAA